MNKIEESTLGSELRKRRKAAGLSAVELCSQTGVPASVIYEFENNTKSLVQVQRIMRLCEFLGIELKSFLNGA
jgi:transcriptional regulator with XRE-family HTH domain